MEAGHQEAAQQVGGDDEDDPEEDRCPVERERRHLDGEVVAGDVELERRVPVREQHRVRVDAGEVPEVARPELGAPLRVTRVVADAHRAADALRAEGTEVADDNLAGVQQQELRYSNAYISLEEDDAQLLAAL